jgi:replicative DNA helicase
MEQLVFAARMVSKPSRAASHRPMLGHLRESGEIEVVADVVLFLHQEHYYDMERRSGRAGRTYAR